MIPERGRYEERAPSRGRHLQQNSARAEQPLLAEEGIVLRGTRAIAIGESHHPGCVTRDNMVRDRPLLALPS